MLKSNEICFSAGENDKQTITIKHKSKNNFYCIVIIIHCFYNIYEIISIVFEIMCPFDVMMI